jgi:DNA-directed RNA polymerase II subunit RPB1
MRSYYDTTVGAKSNVTRGVPRLKEILHISKNIKQPSITIHLNDEYAFDRIKAQDIANKIELTILKDVVVSSTIYYDPSDSNTNIDSDSSFMDMYKVFNELNPIDEENDSMWVLRLEFSRKELMNRNISMDDIHYAIFSQYEKIGYYSDDNADKLIFRIRLNIENSKNDERDINYLKNFEKSILNLVIKGVDKINKISLRQNKDNFVFEDGNYKMKDEWVLDTSGTNLMDILALPYVDTNRTYSNDIIEVYNTLGIDAAKKLLINEINEVIDFSGNYVNYRHIALLCEYMTNKGILMSIDRFGINRDMDIGPLAKCSFEETTEQIFKASIFGELDNLDGVSANIMMGQMIPCGTGNTNILLDEMKFLNIKKELKKVEADEEDTYCDNNIGIDFDIDGIQAD